MEYTKDWYKSKTMRSGLVLLISLMLGNFGYTISPELQGDTVQQILAVVDTIASIVMLYGRYTATTQLK